MARCALLFHALSFACSAGGSDASSTGADLGSLDLPAGPPAVLDLGTDVLRLTEGETVTFTAVVDDPNGPGDVEEVHLEAPTGEIYGSMLEAGGGRFVLVLAWSEIHDVVSIDFEGEEIRRFAVRATDRAGGEGVASTPVALTCLAIRPAACDGVCVDLDTDRCP